MLLAARSARLGVCRTQALRHAVGCLQARRPTAPCSSLFAHSHRSLAMSASAAPGSGPGPADATAAASTSGTPQPDPIVQYVVLRKDLWAGLKWPLGSVAAQACHASSAAMWSFKDDPEVQEYLAPENLDHMHKVVLEVKGEEQLRSLSAKLTEAGVQHKLWVEQPEDFPTCLATKPARKSGVAPHMKKFQLCKSAIGA